MCYSIRNGIVEDILAQQLVPGDLILIGTGDRVPADVRLLEVTDVYTACVQTLRNINFRAEKYLNSSGIKLVFEY